MDLKAKMPSKVESIDVAVGDVIKAGTPVAVLEAMKMKNPLVCPIDGTVKSIAVTVGARVKPGALIVVVE
jgi:biotin carboxyl carrier protein